MEKKVKTAYEDYIRLGDEIKKLQERRKKAQGIIKKYHADTKQAVIIEEGFKSQIVATSSTSLVEDKVIEKFGADKLADCYVTKDGTNFKCVKLIEG